MMLLNFYRSTKLGKNMMESMRQGRSSNWTGYQAQHVIPAELSDHSVLQEEVFNLQKNIKTLQQSGLSLYPSQGASIDLWQRSLDRIG